MVVEMAEEEMVVEMVVVTEVDMVAETEVVATEEETTEAAGRVAVELEEVDWAVEWVVERVVKEVVKEVVKVVVKVVAKVVTVYYPYVKSIYTIYLFYFVKSNYNVNVFDAKFTFPNTACGGLGVCVGR